MVERMHDTRLFGSSGRFALSTRGHRLNQQVGTLGQILNIINSSVRNMIQITYATFVTLYDARTLGCLCRLQLANKRGVFCLQSRAIRIRTSHRLSPSAKPMGKWELQQ
jgi:hypothetical protein